MNKEQAETCIRNFAQQGCVGFSRHCSKQMQKRTVTADDFLQVAMWGNVVSVTKNPKTQHWKCEVVGTDIDGEKLTLIVALDEARQMITCITVY